MHRTYVYVDAFNLYYRALRSGPYRWVDVDRLCRAYLKQNDILKIRYFTARVEDRPNDPDQAMRQDIYFRALRTIPHLEIHLGHYLTDTMWLPLADSTDEPPQMAKVMKTEEKGSDVNLASYLLLDAFRNSYDVAVVISSDSDLVEPIRLVRGEFGKKVILLSPKKGLQANLNVSCDLVKYIRTGAIAACLFPETLEDQVGSFSMPAAWASRMRALLRDGREAEPPDS